ncbi:MAG: sugar ABC transporter ATP-binding protein [Thaumarchaeota archaeon]|nr:sugar ABC transporter ATP-binding protein [Nitrososphaerota archaeon]
MAIVIQTQSVRKKFPGVEALKGISITLESGRIYGLVGENGAGKSTFIKVLMGIHQADAGYLIIRGMRLKSVKSPAIARKHLKMDAIFQESSLIPNLSIAENLFIDRLAQFYRGGVLDRKALKMEAEKALEKVGVKLDVDSPAAVLTEDLKRLVEFARILLTDPDIIILDEVTAPLESTLVKKLFDMLRDLKKRGKTIILISHRLNEILDICDKIIVFKDGKLEGVVDNEGVEDKQQVRTSIIKMMTGSEVGLSFPEKTGLKKRGKLVLRIRGLSNEFLKDINLDLYEGEIVGLAGLRGQGQSMLLRTIVGLVKKKKGELYLDGEKVEIRNPRDAVRHGIFYLSDSRDEEELWLSQDVLFNISNPSARDRSIGGFIRKSTERKICEEMVSKLRIETPSLAQIVKNLSGGNRQKVVLGRKLLSKPKVFLADQPTKGLDISAKTEIYSLMRKLASEEGIPVLTVLNDLPEVVNLPDRVIVMREGAIVKEFSGESISEEELLDSYYG